jgi:2-amino-4-hydroxy-6-hydroxymethyldihydropteridine diphosphokinase
MQFIGLGSNKGDRLMFLETAIQLLTKSGVEFRSVSEVYQTVPFGPIEQDSFLNAVAEIRFWGTAEELLNCILQVEQQLGRERVIRWGPRTIDIDILAFGELILHTEKLSVPHPGIAERAFVLVPWAEIAPNYIIPGIAKTVQELKDALPEGELANVVRFDNHLD